MAEMTGTVLTVDAVPAGSAVAEDYVADSFELAVYDVFDFAPDGGEVSIGGVVYAYLSADWDTSVLTLDPASGFPGAALEDEVLVEPYSETKTAHVQLGPDSGDALLVTVPHALSALLEPGVRDPGTAEAVLITETEPGLWQLLDVLDRKAELTPEAGESLPDHPSDGFPPAVSPDAESIGGIGSVHIRWAAIENADPVTYEVHGDVVPDFVVDSTTLIATTAATSITVKTDATGTPLAYDTTYYFAVVATDADGAAAPGDLTSAQLFRVTGPDIAADYVYAGNIVVDQLLGGILQADVTVSGSIRTADSGARVEMGPFGIVQYDSTGTPTTLLGNDGLATFKGQVLASTLSVTDGMSIRGTANEIAQAGSLTLAAGVSAAANAPTVVNDYETLPGWKEGDGDPWAAGYEFKCMHRVGSQWFVGSRQVSSDYFIARTWNDDGTFGDYFGKGWTAQQIQRCAYVNSGLPVYAFRGTDRRIIADEHSTNNGAVVNALSWDFEDGLQPSGTTTVGTVSFSSGSVKIDATSGVPDSSLERTLPLDMRGRRFTVKVVPNSPSFAAAGQVIEVRMRNPANGEYILARLEGENGLQKVRLQTYNGDSGSTKTALVTVLSSYTWWRLTESNGDAKLQVSSTGSSWSTAATITNHGLTDTDLSGMIPGLIVRAGDGGEATTARFDNVTLGAGVVDYGDIVPWVDSTNAPALGSDGTNILAAERTSDNRIKIYEIDPRSPGRILTTYTSGVSTDFAFVTPLVTVAKGSFDFGSTRFIVTTGNSGDQWAAVFTVSGTTLTYQRNESFYIPGQAGTGYDGTIFQTLASDGTRRKHTAITWTDVPDWAKTWYAATTWYDGDSGGTGTHETTPSPRAAFTFRKRSRYTITSGPIPDLGGTDDPDRIRIYIASAIAATLYRQATTAAGINSGVFTTATFSGTAAPALNNFPGAIAARIINAGSSLVVSGDGTIKGTTIEATTELKSPLATVDRLVVTDRTFVKVPLGANYTIPAGTTAADLGSPGITYSVDVDSTSDIYRVALVMDLQVVTGGNRIAVVTLVVDGVTQDDQALSDILTTGARGTASTEWLITGLTAGAKTFKIQARYSEPGSPTGSARLNATHTKMLIVQQQ